MKEPREQLEFAKTRALPRFPMCRLIDMAQATFVNAARVAVSLLLIFVMPTLLIGQANETQPSELQDYLRRHRLQRLHVRSLEIQLSSELDQSRRRNLASQLAGYYEEYFFSQNSAGDQGFVSRAKQLMRDYPFTSSLSLRIAVQHSVFLAGERDFQKWWQAGSQPRDRANLSNAFLSLIHI